MVTTFPFSHEIRMTEGRSSVRRVLFSLGARKLTGSLPWGRLDLMECRCYKAPRRRALQKSMQEKARKCVVTRKWHPRCLDARLWAPTGHRGHRAPGPQAAGALGFPGFSGLGNASRRSGAVIPEAEERGEQVSAAINKTRTIGGVEGSDWAPGGRRCFRLVVLRASLRRWHLS